MKQIGWTFDIKSKLSKNVRKHLRGELSKINVLDIKTYITFFKEYLGKLGKDDSMAIWFKPAPVQEPGSKELRYFSNTYMFFLNNKGEITLRRNDGELLVEINNGSMSEHCGEGLSVIKAILTKII